MACGCNKAGGKWKVSYPGGKFAIKNSEASAKLAAARVAGATYAKMS
jgi:hypothetical protein